MAGFNFRGSSGYVTDASGDVYVLYGDAYPTVRGGETFGYETTMASVVGTRDRSSSVDPRLAGMHYVVGGGPVTTFRVDLPSAGDYEVRAAFGDVLYSHTSQQNYELADDVTSFQTISTGMGAGQFCDATGVVRGNAASWVANNEALSHTFSSTVLRLKYGGGPSDTVVAHLAYEAAAPASEEYTYTGTGGFTLGGAAITDLAPIGSEADTGDLYPGTVSQAEGAAGDLVWQHPEYVQDLDDTLAWVNFGSGDPSYTQYLIVSNFGADVPLDATITGLEVALTARTLAEAESFNIYVGLYDTVGDEFVTSPAVTWGVTQVAPFTYTKGGKDDLWGLPEGTLTPSYVNSAGAGVAIRARNILAIGGILVDAIAVKVYYRLPGGDGAQSHEYTASGGFAIGGTGAPAKVKAIMGQGGLILAGGAAVAREKVVVGQGGLTIAGQAAVSKTKVTTAAGGLVLAGQAQVSRTKTVTGTGGLTLAGAGGYSRTKAYAGDGGLSLSGAATILFTSVGAYEYVGSGGIAFGGSAMLVREKVVVGSGGLSFAGTAGRAKVKAHTATGGLSFSGQAMMVKTKTYTVEAEGGISLGGAAQVARLRQFEFVGSGGLQFGGQAMLVKEKVYAMAGGIEFGGSASYSKYDPDAPIESTKWPQGILHVGRIINPQ